MELLVIFTSEEEGVDEILKIIADKGIEHGVVLESQGMGKILGHSLSAEQIFGLGDRRPFNKTVMAIIDKEKVSKVIELVNNYWKSDEDGDEKKNRVMFTLPMDNLTIGL